MLEIISFLIVGIAIGVSIIGFLLNGKIKKSNEENLALSSEKVIKEEKINQLQQELTSLKEQFENERTLSNNKSVKIATLESENKHLSDQVEQKLKEVEELQKKLTTEFENIANRILQARTKEFGDLQNQKLSELIKPFKEKIQSFEKKVEETYEKELRDKLNLSSEVKRLFELNQKISTEANNLTRALKGDVKKMGNWGELILERILEQSGLSKGREYDREVSMENSEGSTIRPDVIVHLPDNKHIIIDSKLSLIAYERYVNSDNEDDRVLALKEHLTSMRQHISKLFEKKYSTAKDINTPDFVLMFVPVEASFAAAVEADSDLFGFAWEKKIIPVSPSTLLATLRTISSIWKQENQNRNALEIARQGGAMYDKLVLFLQDLEKVGKSINQLRDQYDGAMGKLNLGRGNLISRAEKIKTLGAKVSKEIPTQFMIDEEE